MSERIRQIEALPLIIVAGLIAWQCQCNVTGTAATKENAALDWVAHHDLEHEGTISAAEMRSAMANA